MKDLCIFSLRADQEQTSSEILVLGFFEHPKLPFQYHRSYFLRILKNFMSLLFKIPAAYFAEKSGCKSNLWSSSKVLILYYEIYYCCYSYKGS